VKEFDREGIDIRIATDDGTAGHHGFVTDVLRPLLDQSRPQASIFCCGPEPMMKAVSRLAEKANVPCWLSLETPMACGFGACFSCVARIKQDHGDWDYRRVCVEGPVFPSHKVVLEDIDFS
jgi:dihydroorotate dehydrogenase electron transfer subunit